MDRIAFVYPTNSGETNRAKIDRVKKSNCRAGQSKSGRNKRFAQLRKAQYREPPKKPQESRRVRVQCNRSTRGKLTTGRGCVEDEVFLPNRIYPIICVTSVSASIVLSNKLFSLGFLHSAFIYLCYLFSSFSVPLKIPEIFRTITEN